VVFAPKRIVPGFEGFVSGPGGVDALAEPARGGHGHDVGTATPVEWTTFECDGRTFEYAAMPTKHKTRPRGWPSHKPSPGPWVPIVLVVVRKPGPETGPGMVYPDGTVITMQHAIETARLFWADVTR
jgi:hypothetical protein